MGNDKFKVVFEKLTNPGVEVWEPRLPQKAHSTDAGMDFFAATNVEWTPHSTETHLTTEFPDIYQVQPNPHYLYTAVVSTGLRVKLPGHLHMRIASRSGLAFNKNILAFPGTIDNSYTGEIKIKLFSFVRNEPINVGDKIAQGILFAGFPEMSIVEGVVNTDTDRGEKGFGSTDAKL